MHKRINWEEAWVAEIIRDCFIELNNIIWVEIKVFRQFDINSVGSKVMMLGYHSRHWMMHNFIADVRIGGDLLKCCISKVIS